MAQDLHDWLAEALDLAVPALEENPLFGFRVERAARRRTTRRRWAMSSASAVLLVGVGVGSYGVVQAAHGDESAARNPATPAGQRSYGLIGPGCLTSDLDVVGRGGFVRVEAQVGQQVSVTARLRGWRGDIVHWARLVVMPPGYQVAGPGAADDPANALATSNTLRDVHPDGQRVNLVWTPTAPGRYPLVDTGSDTCAPGQTYGHEGSAGVVIVR